MPYRRANETDATPRSLPRIEGIGDRMHAWAIARKDPKAERKYITHQREQFPRSPCASQTT